MKGHTKIKAIVGAGVLAISLALGSGSAGAMEVGDCQELIATLQTALAGTSIGGKNSAQTLNSLDSKLSGASTKLGQAKSADACTKLNQFRSKVLDLAMPNKKGETKIAPADADDLTTGSGGVDDVIQCVNALEGVDCGILANTQSSFPSQEFSKSLQKGF